MTWDSAALATMVQTAVVSAAAVVALVQLRHLRHQNDLASFMQLLSVYNSPEFNRARGFVATELKDRLRDPKYREEIENGVLTSDRHPESLVIIYFQEVGQLLAEGVIDARLVIPFHYRSAPALWKCLLPVIALRRNVSNPYYAKGFEAFVIRCSGLDAGRRAAHYHKKTPASLKPKWDDTQHDLEEAYRNLRASTDSA